jgi:hypothetical protein
VPLLLSSVLLVFTSNMDRCSVLKGGGVAAAPNHGLGSLLGAQTGRVAHWRLRGSYVAAVYNRGLLDLLY